MLAAVMRVPGLVALCAIALIASACAPATDAELLSDIQARLAESPDTAGLSLSIDVDDGIVRLSGRTGTLDQQPQAMRLARSVSGVKVVINDMWLNNDALAARVTQALASDPEIGGIPIEVTAREDTVHLMSDQTNQEQRTRAVRVAAAVAGVAQVEDLMK